MALIKGVHYVVTKGSTDETFYCGDHIVLEENGSISCTEAMGWVDAECVQEAVIGMEYEVDLEWIAKKRKRLLNGLSLLEGGI